MIPSNPVFPQSMVHLFYCILSFALIISITITDGLAMSRDTGQASTTYSYTPSEWHENADPDVDAALALDNNDHRLLAFALRATNIPGIESELIEIYSEQCGLRFLKNFGDVVQSEEALNNMNQAREYALRYNAIVKTRCDHNE